MKSATPARTERYDRAGNRQSIVLPQPTTLSSPTNPLNPPNHGSDFAPLKRGPNVREGVGSYFCRMHHLLCLGDSYTIGEAVLLTESFPYQTVQRLRRAGLSFAAPEIIAKTGWTTDELLQHLEGYPLLPRYDFVTLLIGVNNQYRGYAVEQFEKEFALLLTKAIGLAASPQEVFVLSIPDWGATPFAAGRDTQKISTEIAHYNHLAYNICTQNAVSFLHTASSFDVVKNNAALTASDGLHPSAKELEQWSATLAAALQQRL